MRDTHFVGYGMRAGEGLPVFIFRVEFFGDHDLDGELDIQLGIAQPRDKALFAIVSYPGDTKFFEYDHGIGELLAALIEKQQFIVAFDFEGRDYDLPGGYSPLLNIDWEEDVDALDYYEIEAYDIPVLKDMKEVLDGARVGQF